MLDSVGYGPDGDSSPFLSACPSRRREASREHVLGPAGGTELIVGLIIIDAEHVLHRAGRPIVDVPETAEGSADDLAPTLHAICWPLGRGTPDLVLRGRVDLLLATQRLRV